MAAPRNRKHILVRDAPSTEPYTPHGRRIETKKPPAPASRATHGEALKKTLAKAEVDGLRRRDDAVISVHGRPGYRLVRGEITEDDHYAARR